MVHFSGVSHWGYARANDSVESTFSREGGGKVSSGALAPKHLRMREGILLRVSAGMLDLRQLIQ